MNRVLTVFLLVVLLAAVVLLAYVIASPRTAEEFTEFYILDYRSMTDIYPTGFVLENGKIVEVKYDGEIHKAAYGRVILGISNHENTRAEYDIKVVSDNMTLPLYFKGAELELIGPISLGPGEKWEEEIGFSPQTAGEGEKVSFVLYKDGTAYFEEPPYLWIDVANR